MQHTLRHTYNLRNMHTHTDSLTDAYTGRKRHSHICTMGGRDTFLHTKRYVHNPKDTCTTPRDVQTPREKDTNTPRGSHTSLERQMHTARDMHTHMLRDTYQERNTHMYTGRDTHIWRCRHAHTKRHAHNPIDIHTP